MENKVYIDPYPKTMKMLGLERINIDCGNNTSIVTPANIAKDMVALLPDEVFIPESKFLDICCKSGIFLTSIREKLMNSKAMIESFPDDKERYKYITNNQLYGIAPNGQCQMYSVRAVYGTLKVDNPHILCFGVFDQYKTACLNNNHKMLIEEMKKEFGQMKFDVVIGNPPYNKDIYLDFVTLGHTLASKYDCWITPAKWQAKGGQKNKQFREDIVPHIKNIVYYPDSDDVFDIRLSGGLSYYLLDKCTHSIKETKCISTRCSSFNSDWEEQEIITIHRNLINNIVRKCSNNRIRLEEIKGQKYVGDRDSKIPYSADGDIYVMQGDTCCGMIKKCNIRDSGIKDVDKYKCIMHSMLISPVTNSDGTHLGIQKPIILMPNQIPKGIYFEIFCSDSLAEVESLQSYFNCKLIRFLFYINAMSTYMDESNFDKVPAPEAFDHIFTDEELYKKYNLMQEEINIIESVIKERK